MKKRIISILLFLIASLNFNYGSQVNQKIKNIENDTPATEKPFPQDELDQLQAEFEPDVELNFNNASLQNIVDQISLIFNITFIPDDVVKSPGTPAKALSSSKISFKTNVPFSRKKAWNFFTMFLELADWSLVPTSDPTVYRITTIDKANKLSLPTYINTSFDILPDSDQRIRYVCFLENSTPDQMEDLLKNLQSAHAIIKKVPLLNAIIITDAAYNVLSLLKIIKELDKTAESQILSVLNLKEAETTEVAALIKDLQNKDDSGTASFFSPKNEPGSLYYFSKDVNIITAPRTNSLILIGPEEGVRRIEQFIIAHVDIELKQMYEPVHIYNLNYAPAEQIANILNNVVKFGKTSDGGGKDQGVSAGEAGGVIGGLKYFGDVFIQPEAQGNRLLVRSTQEDWVHLSKIIDQLDKRQPQVAIEVMIVEITAEKLRQLGVQWQTKNPTTVQGQMTGFFEQKAVVSGSSTAPYTNTLISNLINLAKSAPAGTTLLTLGKDSVYAILGLLDKDSQSRLLANPFIVATNKYTSTVLISETRRATSQLVGTSNTGIQSFDARLQVSITPQINEFGLINLDINIILEDFTKADEPENVNKTVRQVRTNANIADKEVLALGGLTKRKKSVLKTKIPILGNIPLIGNIFKNEKFEYTESNLIIFMSPTIIQPTDETSNLYTRNKSTFMTIVSRTFAEKAERDERDPVYRWFFKEADHEIADDIEAFMNKGERKKKKNPEQQRNSANLITQSVSTEEEGS